MHGHATVYVIYLEAGKPAFKYILTQLDPAILAKVSRGLGAPMTGIGMDQLGDLKFEDRGW